jgi:two-component system, NarL family, response regulator DesR
MIRTLIALEGRLVRGALSYVLANQADIEVVGELHRADELEPAMHATRPDVTIVDLDLVSACDLAKAAAAARRRGRSRVLVLVEPRRAGLVCTTVSQHPAELGLVGTNAAPERVVDSVRRLAKGEPVIDADLVVAALGKRSPLTPREAQVLDVAADGCPVNEIATRLALAPGTVRNHLSRVMAKAGARTRIDAVRIARDSGWI